jgi:hypothetical protein
MQFWHELCLGLRAILAKARTRFLRRAHLFCSWVHSLWLLVIRIHAKSSETLMESGLSLHLLSNERRLRIAFFAKQESSRYWRMEYAGSF